MAKSATDLMGEIIYSSVVDALDALKAASGGVPNTLLRSINAVHANTAFADLPPELRTAIAASVRSGFNRLLKEGYAVAPSQPAPNRAAPPAAPTETRPFRPAPRPLRPGPRPPPRKPTGRK